MDISKCGNLFISCRFRGFQFLFDHNRDWKAGVQFFFILTKSLKYIPFHKDCIRQKWVFLHQLRIFLYRSLISGKPLHTIDKVHSVLLHIRADICRKFGSLSLFQLPEMFVLLRYFLKKTVSGCIQFPDFTIQMIQNLHLLIDL